LAFFAPRVAHEALALRGFDPDMAAMAGDYQTFA